MHLYFTRHGESTSNYGEVITGRQDVPLTEHGQQQAREAGEYLVEHGIKIDRIITSPLMRTHDTAKLIANQIGYPQDSIQVDDLVIERSYGTMEGQPTGSTASMSDERIKECGGEIDSEIRVRAQTFLDSIKNTDDTILVVSHTGFGRRLRAVVEHIPTDQSGNFKNADITDLGVVL